MLKVCSLLFLLALSRYAAGQAGAESAAPDVKSTEPVAAKQGAPIVKPEPDELRQELDADIAASSKIPADPLIKRDPMAHVFQRADKLRDHLFESECLKFGATNTLDEVRHEQLSGRLDFTGAWAVYDHGSAGSISLLIRSGTNIGRTQQF